MDLIVFPAYHIKHSPTILLMKDTLQTNFTGKFSWGWISAFHFCFPFQEQSATSCQQPLGRGCSPERKSKAHISIPTTKRSEEEENLVSAAIELECRSKNPASILSFEIIIKKFQHDKSFFFLRRTTENNNKLLDIYFKILECHRPYEDSEDLSVLNWSLWWTDLIFLSWSPQEHTLK